MHETIRPFRLDVPQTDLDDLRERGPHPLAGRAARRRLGGRGAAGLLERPGRLLAHQLRLACP